MASTANGETNFNEGILDDMKVFYGRTIQCSEDLELKICSAGKRKKVSRLVREAMNLIREDVASKDYGCSCPIPDSITGCEILDLGSGAGYDCFLLSKLVGPSGHVTGVDMTQEQLDFAREAIPYHMKAFGFDKPNVHYVLGYIEKLGEAGFKDNSFDLIISNCVINLSPDKKTTFSEAARVLKDGGELYFSDMYVCSPVPEGIKGDKELWMKGLTGALRWDQLTSEAREAGFSTPRLASSLPINIYDEELKPRLEGRQYASATYRMFKLPTARALGIQEVTYKGTIVDNESKYELDVHHTFPTGKAVTVDKETAAILKLSRYSRHFKFTEPGKTEKNMDPFAYIQASNVKSCDQAGATCAKTS